MKWKPGQVFCTGLMLALILGGVGYWQGWWPRETQVVDTSWQELDLAYRYLEGDCQTLYAKLHDLYAQEGGVALLTAGETRVMEEVFPIFHTNHPGTLAEDQCKLARLPFCGLVELVYAPKNPAVQTALERYRQSLPPGLGDSEKVQYAYEYVCDQVSYRSGELDQTLYGAMVEGEGVCSGYARMFQYLLWDMGIPCGAIQGWATNSEGKTERHQWNMVELNGENYLVDVTWGDGAWGVDYSYLCVTSGDLARSHQADALPSYPPCVDTGENYYVRQNLVLDELSQEEMDRIADGQLGTADRLSFRCAYPEVYWQVRAVLEEGHFGLYHVEWNQYQNLLILPNDELYTYCILMAE